MKINANMGMALYKLMRLRPLEIKTQYGYTRQDRIRNTMVESRLRWFEHVCRRSVEASLKRVDQMEDSSVVRLLEVEGDTKE